MSVSQVLNIVQGGYYEWQWPREGAGAMARFRGLRPNGKAVTRVELPDLDPGIGAFGFQVFDDLSWVISPEWLYKNDCCCRKLENFKKPAPEDYGFRWDKFLESRALAVT